MRTLGRFMRFSYLCSMILHVFNPEHDMALAAGRVPFTAPHAGRQLRNDLDFMPALWAKRGDVVLVNDVDNAFDKLRHLGMQVPEVDFVTLQGLGLLRHKISGVSPWGWDISIKHQLTHAGVEGEVMPSDGQLEAIRRLSSREWAAAHLQGQAVFVANLTELEHVIDNWRACVLKSPWSCSGRGVRYVGGKLDTSTAKWVANIIARQGGIAIEPYYNKVIDFGMEFEAGADGTITYCGLSLFHTVKGAYVGNLLVSEQEKEDFLARYISRETLRKAREKAIKVISPAIRNLYQGPFGIDMMLYRPKEVNEIEGASDTPQPLKLNACVELNLRRTMGHVALVLRALGNKYERRLMRIEYDGNRYHLRVNRISASQEERDILL